MDARPDCSDPSATVRMQPPTSPPGTDRARPDAASPRDGRLRRGSRARRGGAAGARAPLDRLAAGLDRPWVIPGPDHRRRAGARAGLRGRGRRSSGGRSALVLWLVSRLADGLDGPLARRRRAPERPATRAPAASSTSPPTSPSTAPGSSAWRSGTAGAGAPWEPFLLVLLAYYLNGTAFLAFSSIAERSGRRLDDGRSLSFLGGLAEGTETVVVHALWLLLPGGRPGGSPSVWAVVVCAQRGPADVGGLPVAAVSPPRRSRARCDGRATAAPVSREATARPAGCGRGHAPRSRRRRCRSGRRGWCRPAPRPACRAGRPA